MIAFAASMPQEKSGNKYLLICKEYLPGWPIVRATARLTEEVVLNFMKDKVIPPFGAPKTIINDEVCFIAQGIRQFKEKNSTNRHTVLADAPISHGRAKRMIGTIKRAFCNAVEGSPDTESDDAVASVVFWYH